MGLREKIAKLQAKVWEQEQKKTKKEAKLLVGKFLKYKNCYSCPEKESDYWWMYCGIIGVTEDGLCQCIKFQKDSREKFTFERDTNDPRYFKDGFVSVSKTEFQEKLRGYLSEIERTMHEARGYF